jgi:hypothetical protein
MLSASTENLAMPRWSQWALKRTASDLSAGSLPSHTPRTFLVAIFWTVVGDVPFDMDAKRNRLESAGAGLLEGFIHRQTDRGEQLVAGPLGKPARKRQGGAPLGPLDLGALELADDRVSFSSYDSRCNFSRTPFPVRHGALRQPRELPHDGFPAPIRAVTDDVIPGASCFPPYSR